MLICDTMESVMSAEVLNNPYCNNLNEENKTFKFEKRHVSATPVPSSGVGHFVRASALLS